MDIDIKTARAVGAALACAMAGVTATEGHPHPPEAKPRMIALLERPIGG